MDSKRSAGTPAATLMNQWTRKLSPSLFHAIRLARAGIGSRSNRMRSRPALLVARVGPPAIFVLRQFAHHGALLSCFHLFAVAVAQRSLRVRLKCRRGIGQSGGGYRCQKNCCTDGLNDFVLMCSRLHEPFLNAKTFPTIERGMGFAGSRVIDVPVQPSQVRFPGGFRARCAPVSS